MAGNPGLLCIDEAESFDNEKGSELRTILLGGYKAGNQAVRAERTTGGAFMNKRYETYGPKALGSINPLDPTLGSRTVVISMKPATRRIATFPFDSDEWSEMRNQLYLFAMHHTGNISHLLKVWEADHRHTRASELFNSRQDSPLRPRSGPRRPRDLRGTDFTPVLLRGPGGPALADG